MSPSSSSSSFSASSKILPLTPLLPDIASSRIHLRPARHSDLAQILGIFTHYILNTVSTPLYNPPTMEFMVDMLDKVQAERLPYIVAVTGGAGSSAVVHTAGRSSATPATIGDAEGAGKGNSDLVLGYIYAVPYYSYEGFSVRTGTLSAYIHPELRMSGLGGRLCRLMLNLLKCPTRYTSPPSSCSSSTTPTTSLPLSDNDEENIATYTAWKNIPLRPLKTVVVCTIIDTEGIGMGKDRFFEKMGYHKVGIVTACMEKFAKIWDKGIWAMQLENWDEVKGRPKINRRSDAAAMNGGGSGWQMETKERVKEEERLGHLLIRSML